jgi:hypothetical protein
VPELGARADDGAGALVLRAERAHQGHGGGRRSAASRGAHAARVARSTTARRWDGPTLARSGGRTRASVRVALAPRRARDRRAVARSRAAAAPSATIAPASSSSSMPARPRRSGEEGSDLAARLLAQGDRVPNRPRDMSARGSPPGSNKKRGVLELLVGPRVITWCRPGGERSRGRRECAQNGGTPLPPLGTRAHPCPACRGTPRARLRPSEDRSRNAARIDRAQRCERRERRASRKRAGSRRHARGTPWAHLALAHGSRREAFFPRAIATSKRARKACAAWRLPLGHTAFLFDFGL